MEAFDDLEKLVDNLVDCGKTQQWAREIKQQPRLSKQYLKGDYKVGAYFIIMRCLRRSDVVNFFLRFTATSFLLSKSSLCLIYEKNSLQFTVIRLHACTLDCKNVDTLKA